MPSRKRVLVVKTGDAALDVRAAYGDYDRWFLPALKAAGVEVEVVAAHLGARPERHRADAWILTGSPLSAVHPVPWMRRLADSLRERIEVQAPTLGVCFGHQLLALALGVSVVANPRGREIGTVTIALTPAGRTDPLFEGCPPHFAVQATHEDIPAGLPEGAVSLAENGFGLQAFALGARVRGVQFHPELSPAGMSAVIRARRERLDLEGQTRGLSAGEWPTQLLAGIAPSPIAGRVLTHFLSRFL